MVKAYLRYEQTDSWGVISSRSSVAFDRNGKYFFAASLEKVAVWDVKQAVLIRYLDQEESITGKKKREVTSIASSPVGDQLAVGYQDGKVRLWSTKTWKCESTMAGHSSAVTCLVYSSSGDTLASGSQDTDCILWDVSGESGLFKLKGHKGQITGLAFIDNNGSQDLLITVSKDEYIKVWDLNQERCIQTVVSNGGEAWSVAYNAATRRVVVGASDGELRGFEVTPDTAPHVLREMGSLRRSTGDKAMTLLFVGSSEGSADGGLLICQGAGKVADVWRVRTQAEAEKRKKRRKKRKEEKKRSKAEIETEVAAESNEDTIKTADEYELICTIRSKHKVSSCACLPDTKKSKKYLLRAVFALSNNSIEVWDVKDNELETVGEKVSTIDGPGHRSDVRSLALTSDDGVCMSTSNSGVKIWNPRNGNCIGSIESGYGLCCLFAPGNKHAVVGTKEGTIEILDIGSAERITVVEAHKGPIWSICPQPDGSGFISGSADKDVKFWEWTLDEAVHGTSQSSSLSIDCVQTMTMTDDVLGVKFTPNGALLIVSLLDSTVKVYFADTLKFFLSLYGHKLPVLSMDVSSDSTILATGSADKNIKIWGLDYGDCHRSIFAHDDSVMAVAFVPGTHYLFSAGKDGMVKYWDADKFEMLLELKGHHGEVWALAVSSLGEFILTGSHDRSIRRWEKTEEAFFIEEEKEKRLESLFEEDLEAPERKSLVEDTAKEDGDGTSTIAGKKTLETVSAADAIVEALDMASAEEERIREAADKSETSITPNPLLLGLSPSDYVLRAVSRVRGSELEQALLLIPFLDALRLLQFVCLWLKRGGNIELLARVAILLCRVHMQQLMATAAARTTLLEIRHLIQSRLQNVKDIWGFNVAGMEYLKRQVENGAKRPNDVSITAAKLRQRLE